MSIVKGWFKTKPRATATDTAVIAHDNAKGDNKIGLDKGTAACKSAAGALNSHAGDGVKGAAVKEITVGTQKVKVDGDKKEFEQDIEYFLNLNVEKVVRDLTMIDWNVYKKITRQDVENSDTSDTIQNLRENHDNIFFWTLETVLSGKDAKSRGKIITKFLRIASGLVESNDFNAAHAIVDAMQIFAIWRLDKTWKKLTKNKANLWHFLKELFSGDDNYHNLSKQMEDSHAVNNIVIPYLELFIKDFKALQFLEYDRRIGTIRRNGIIWRDMHKLKDFQSDIASNVSVASYYTASQVQKSFLEAVVNDRSRLLEQPKRFYKVMNVSEINLDDY